ncbi:hypothetical protein BO82DRAFT_405234 [Aspergillus uvarum CBS 121591]|uniref:BTB domain-containing protein n=1 Tax=Aspergillus uvarum CBS 121591 TaxID=1448315 RepID=A0A319C278_9EURO|nr:hypothetical protein BO82DRAFT_405234 [Aspergillus uvarum CBS 121591]PYH78381.1 hypothetical protein BO82DRAFT_405234 [Aspergillus uvarum CBS 121591]
MEQDLQTPLHASREENDIRGTAKQIEDPSYEIETPRPVIKKHAKKGNKKKAKRNRPTTCAATSISPDRNPPSIEEAASEEPAPQEPPAAEGSAWWPEGSPLAEEPSSVQYLAAVEHAADFDQAADEPAPAKLLDSDTDEPLDVPCFRIQVSAKHLILASSVFKRILTGGWMESTKFLKQGSVEIDTDSWDLDALIIVLRLIHCQSFHKPRKLSLEMLAKVAVIADYYECGEAVDMLARVWISALDETIPATYSRDVILRI